jgi:hypothetical protein
VNLADPTKFNFLRALELRDTIERDKLDWGWNVSPFHPYFCRWECQTREGISIPLPKNPVTDEQQEWLRANKWKAFPYKESLIIAPLVYAPNQAFYYHTTEAANRDGIFSLGLLTGNGAGKSTTEREDCQDHIYVTLDVEAGKGWVKDCLLAKNSSETEWVILEIDATGVGGGVYRDPASCTGYILEDKKVEPRFISQVDRVQL